MLEKYKSTFTETRWAELCWLVSQKGMKVNFHDFTASEIELIIKETVITDAEREGCRLYYIKRVPLQTIARKLGYSEAGSKYQKKKCSRLLRETCCRIFK